MDESKLTPLLHQTLEKARDTISGAKAFIFTAGAGMGVDSNLPDFRGDQGFWNAYPPYAKMGLRFVDMANPAWFARDPEFAWGFYGHRLNLYRETKPHEGFGILLSWAKRKKEQFFVFTSNVDGHFQKAGFDSEKIQEVHGSINYLQCTKQCGQPVYAVNYFEIRINAKNMRAIPPLPLCPNCGALTRPNILMFGDWGYDSMRQDKQSAQLRKWLNQISSGTVVIIECGAGSAVPTVRMTSENLVHHLGGLLIRINPREAEVPDGHISIPLGALEALKTLDSMM